MKENTLKKLWTFAITGTYHGSLIQATTEGEARRKFHSFYNGESIIELKKYNIHPFIF